MIFEGRFNRARKFQQEQNAKRQGGAAPGNAQDDVELSDMMEKGDMFAMIVSALITILPIALIVLVFLAAVGYFFVVR